MKRAVILVSLTILFGSIYSQNILTYGISTQTQIRSIITDAGFSIQDETISNINASTLSGKKVLALFNGGQTWNGVQLFSDSQANDIVQFIQNGGKLYISSRKGYENILSQLGVSVSGSDGGSSGFNWPLIERSATNLNSHSITQGLSSIVGDVGANFSLDNNWNILGKDNKDNILLANRNFGYGEVILWYGQRSFRDPGATANVYETDINEGSNKQFYINIFNYFSVVSSFDLLSYGISTQTQIRSIITDAGFSIQDETISNINASTLSGKKVLALFNGGQTWNGVQLFSDSQANDIVQFIQNGGKLYISSRKGYENILSLLGVSVSGSDGGSSGFNWPLIERSATNLSSHSITQGLSSIVGDVGANFSLDNNWNILGKDNKDNILLANRNFGYGEVILWYGQRSFRDPGATANVYETDINEGSNKQFYINIFNYFSTITSYKNLEKNIALKIFPNPTSEFITIHGLNSAIETILYIYNCSGQKIIQKTFYASESTINLSEQPVGIYFLKINNTESFKIIKQ